MLASVLVLLLSSCTSIRQHTGSDASSALVVLPVVAEGVSPNGPTCNRRAANWGDISLYEMTYGCLPRGWTDWFRTQAVRTELATISSQIARDLGNQLYIEPGIGKVFEALYEVTPNQVKAVILGQDPAPQQGIAMGLSFSTPPGVSSGVTASIQRVLLEAQNNGYCVDLGDGNLSDWADRGVLLLNMALTLNCDEGKDFCNIASHLQLWSHFTDMLFAELDNNDSAKAFIFWGSVAGAYAAKVNNPNHKVILGGHPSPAASDYGEFFFCKSYFRDANTWLDLKQRLAVDWSLSNSCSALPPPSYWLWNPDTKTSSIYKSCN